MYTAYDPDELCVVVLTYLAIFSLQVSGPGDTSGEIIQSFSTRNGNLKSLDVNENLCTVFADVPLQEMFGYTTHLRLQIIFFCP